MRWIIGFLGALASVFALQDNLFATEARTVNEQMSDESLNTLYETYARKNNLEPELVKAVASVESSERVDAVNPEPGTEGRSLGLMQILCPQELNDDVMGAIWPPENCEDLLTQPAYNIQVGTRILGENVRTLGKWRGVATYNATSARSAPPEGPFPNDEYVQKVKGLYQQFKKQGIFE